VRLFVDVECDICESKVEEDGGTAHCAECWSELVRDSKTALQHLRKMVRILDGIPDSKLERNRAALDKAFEFLRDSAGRDDGGD
jgi:hypothetical protein